MQKSIENEQNEIDSGVIEKNKEEVEYSKPVTSSEVKKGIKRTSSPPQKVNSPDKLRKQESKINDMLDDNFKKLINTVKPGMDQANRKAVDIWTSQGTSSMLQHIMTKEDGTPMSYSESRMRYG